MHKLRVETLILVIKNNFANHAVAQIEEYVLCNSLFSVLPDVARSPQKGSFWLVRGKKILRWRLSDKREKRGAFESWEKVSQKGCFDSKYGSFDRKSGDFD